MNPYVVNIMELNLSRFIHKVFIEEFPKLDLYKIKKNFIINSPTDLKNITRSKYEKFSFSQVQDKDDNKQTFKYQIIQNKFEQNYSKVFQMILKNLDMPYKNLKIDCSLKECSPCAHTVHTDSDNNVNGVPICRFLIPLSAGAPTYYFDKVMDDNKFYLRAGKNKFFVEDKKGIREIILSHLQDMETGEKKLISDDLPCTDNLSHVMQETLLGLNIYKIVEWKVGSIHLFPINNLHSGSDSTDVPLKSMINGVLYLGK